MIAHILIGLVLFALGVVLIVYLLDHYNKEFLFPVGALLIGLGLILATWAPMVYINYQEFETKYEIQTEMFETYKDITNENDNIAYITDLLEINTKLAELKASKSLWGWWSCLPDRVLDLTPIGLGG